MGKKEELDNIRNKYVAKSNNLIMNTRFSYSAREQKALAYITTLLKKPQDNEPVQLIYEFDVLTFTHLCGIKKKGSLYSSTLKLLEDLSNHSFWLTTEDKGYVMCKWINKAWIKPEDKAAGRKGKISVRLDEDIVPYLFNLKSDFYKHQSITLFLMASSFSMGFYQLFISHYNKQLSYMDESIKLKSTPMIDLRMTVDEIKEMFEIGNKNCYKNFNNLKTKVIDVALKEIKEFTELEVTYDLVRGHYNSVTSVVFHIKYKTFSEKYDIEKKINKIIYKNDLEAGVIE